MTPALAPIAPTLGKLVRLLSSDQDHEVLGAARAIQRVLASAGADFHALAGLIEVTAHNRTYGHQDTAPGQDWRVRAMVRFCADHPELLSPKEYNFITTLARRRGKPSERQLEWLCAIYARVSAEGAQS